MTRLVTLLSAPLFFVFAVLSQPVLAATVDAAGAAHLKTVFVNYLDDQKAATKSQKRELKSQGDVLVEPAGTYYAITMPHLTLFNEDGSYTDIGILAINALPGAKDGEWKMTVAVPTPIMGYDAMKKPNLRIDIGGQSFTGLWNETVGNFTKLDARYQNITAVQSVEGITMKIPSASILYNLTQAADGKTWSGPVRYVMDNIAVTKQGDEGESKIGQLEINMDVQNYDPAAVLDYQDKVNSLAAADDTQGLANVFFDLISNAWEGFDSTIAVKDIDLARPAIPGSPAGRLTVKQAAFTFNAKGFRSDSVTMNLRTQYDGFNLAPAPAGFDESTPARLNLDIHIEKLPFKELVRLGREGVQAANTQPDGGKIAGMQAAQLIPQLLTQAGTNLRINQSYLGNKIYNVNMDGILNANLKAVMGAEGKAKLDVTGLDALLALLKTRLQDPSLDAETKKRMNNAMVTMTVLQMAGQQSKDAEGKAVRTYNLELTNDGKIMINGADLSMLKALAGTGQGNKAAPEKAPAP